MLAVALTDAGLALVLVGVVSLVRPLRRLRIPTRRRALAVAAAGAAIAGAGLMMPAAPRHVEHPATALDRALPTYQFHEVHEIAVRAPADRVYRAVKEVAAGEIRFFRTLIWLRRFGRPLPESILNAPVDRPLLDVATATTFALLADTPREVLVGTVVAAPDGWRRGRDGPLTREEFLALRERPGFALAAMTFVITTREDGISVVSTETRVVGTDASTTRRFGAYWRIIYPGSALIRRMWLRAIRERAEDGR
jgi:hypothetical protein